MMLVLVLVLELVLGLVLVLRLMPTVARGGGARCLRMCVVCVCRIGLALSNPHLPLTRKRIGVYLAVALSVMLPLAHLCPCLASR